MFDSLWGHAQRHAGKYGSAIVICCGLTAGWEGYRSHPYVDQLATTHPETWCYGQTQADGPPPPYSRVFTKAECQQELGRSLLKYDAEVKAALTPQAYNTLPPHRHAAMIDFTYNVGGVTFRKSSVAKNLNQGDIVGACHALLLYDRAGGKVIQGLYNRRLAEYQLCVRGD